MNTKCRLYVVTVMPKYTTYAGNHTYGQYIEKVLAKSAADAISQARRIRTDVEGKYGVPATYSAKLFKD